MISGPENKAKFNKFYEDHKKEKLAGSIPTSNPFALLDEEEENNAAWKIRGKDETYATKDQANASVSAERSSGSQNPLDAAPVTPKLPPRIKKTQKRQANMTRDIT